MRPDARAARERKQKIFVVVGGVLLLGLMAIQLPRLLGGSSTPAAAPAVETTIAGSPTGTVPAPVTRVVLVENPPPGAGPGKLTSFSVFAAKDPFVQQVVAPSEVGEAAQKAGGGAKQAPGKPNSKAFTVSGAAPALTIISVNGARQALEPGAAFPAADPVFVLVTEQPNAKTAVVGIAGGAYANGAKTTKLKVGRPLTLVNTTTGARYRVVLVVVGNGEERAAPAKQQP
ncbi:MAG: hypothetical protein ACRDPV_14590 [Gaiellaceae bacterium]